ncbi:zinc finger, CCHC-type containing protein [Tanacetum coccineum]
MDEAIRVSCIIDKLPPSWKDFKHTLKHKKEELTLVELGSHLRIEESSGRRIVTSQRETMLLVYSNWTWLNIVNNIGKSAFMPTFKLNDSIIWAVVRLPDPKLKTLGERGIECIFVGYAEHSKVLEAINDDMDSIMGNNTWVLADLPLGCKPLGCKWIFKRKLKVDGTIEKFKARLVIQGFKQKSGINYFDTYALVARISTIRLLIAMASIHNLIIHQMDVKTTFLNHDLEEEVYMNQPQGFIMPDNENKVDLTKEFFSSRFSMKGMGEADVILGIRIKHESNGIAISQPHYIEKVLKKFNYFDCAPVSTPMDTSEKLMPNNGQAVSQLEYSRVIGCLIYAITCTRPDIAFDVGKLSRYTSNPGTQHWQAIQRASKKQTCITGSTMEYEFVALAAAGKEAE